MLAFTYASILRKTGVFEEAASIARTLPSSYQTCVSLAMAEGALGNFAAGVAAYREALTFQPNDVAVRNDLGELYLAISILGKSELLRIREQILPFLRSKNLQERALISDHHCVFTI